MVELIDLYVKYYNTNTDKFFCLHSGVAISVLSSCYNRFLSDSDITPLDELSNDTLSHFDSIADAHMKEGRSKIEIMQSAYALHLIAS